MQYSPRSDTDGAGISSYLYNGLGDRLQQTVNGQTISYTLDLNAGLTQVLSDGTYTYLYGNGRVAQESTAPEYFLRDALGSVRQMTAQTGEIVYAASYSPYGEVIAEEGTSRTSYGYTGETTDSSGMVYLRSRYYRTVNGRFLNRDTWSGDAKDPGSLNRWAYVQGNPVNLTDPSGRITQWEAFKASLIVRYLRDTYNVYIDVDWGNVWWYEYDLIPGNGKSFQNKHCEWWNGNWRNLHELELTRDAIDKMAGIIGGNANFQSTMKGRVNIRRYTDFSNWAGFTPDPNIGHAIFGDALIFNGAFNSGDKFAKEVIVHELAHVWDFRHSYLLSIRLMYETKSYHWECKGAGYPYISYCEDVYDKYYAIERAPTSYAETNAQEDWAETVMVYIYPQSFGVIDKKNPLHSIRKQYVENILAQIHH